MNYENSAVRLMPRQTGIGESFACFLGPDDEELGESVAGLLLGPDVFVSLVMTRVLERRQYKHT